MADTTASADHFVNSYNSNMVTINKILSSIRYAASHGASLRSKYID